MTKPISYQDIFKEVYGDSIRKMLEDSTLFGTGVWKVEYKTMTEEIVIPEEEFDESTLETEIKEFLKK